MHTHYHEPSQRWFTLDQCETCGCDIQAPNAVTCPDADKLKAAGVTFVTELPGESWHDDDLGMEVCDQCLPA